MVRGGNLATWKVREASVKKGTFKPPPPPLPQVLGTIFEFQTLLESADAPIGSNSDIFKSAGLLCVVSFVCLSLIQIFL